jgi:hypothetical protein
MIMVEKPESLASVGRIPQLRPRTIGAGLSLGVLAAMGLCACPALSAPPQVQIPTEEDLQPSQHTPTGTAGFLSGLGRTNFLLGEWVGCGPSSPKYGISLALQETSEVLGNVSTSGSTMMG